jgi:hypothetical protein
MKRLLLFIMLFLPTIAYAQTPEYQVSVVGTTINITDYKLYSDAFPAGHAGPGEFRYTLLNTHVHVYGKLDVQATTAGVQFSIQLSLPIASTSPNYAYWIGNACSPGPTRCGAIFASQISVEGNNTSVVFKANPSDILMRAYAIQFDYDIE